MKLSQILFAAMSSGRQWIAASENRLAVIGVVALLLIAGVSLFAPVLAPYSPYERSGIPFEKPSLAHLLGCNDVGNDLLSELMWGGRVSLTVGVFAAFFSIFVATALALVAGFFGGAVDRLIMRVVDVIMAIPFLPLVIVLGVFLGAGISTQILVISIVMWAAPCRELRSQVIKTRGNGYIDAAKAMGERPHRIILRHVLRDIAPLVVPQLVSVAQAAILIESSLSFLGLGDPLSKSWGSMLYFANTRAAFLTGAWSYWVLPPGLCIAITCLAFALIGFSLGGRKGLEYYAAGSFVRPFRCPEEGCRYCINKEQPLEASQVSVVYRGSTGHRTEALKNMSLSITRGEVIGIVGESGCGKTTFAMAVLGLLKFPARVSSGLVYIWGDEVLSWPHNQMRKLRGKTIAYIPQNAMNTLNPVMTVYAQLQEAIRVHHRIPKKAEQEEIFRLLDWVQFPRERAFAYNHELSGGMKQRVVIAMALSNRPDIIIADEPTTGLDVLVQKSILDRLMVLKDELHLSVLFITHDLPLATHYGDKLAVVYQGELVDFGPTDSIAMNPTHDYTRHLFSNFPSLHQTKMWSRPVIPEREEGLVVRNLTKTFASKRFAWQKAHGLVHAVNDVSFYVRPGEVLGIIGESGSGKTTVSRLIMGLEKMDRGQVVLQGQELHSLRGAEFRKALQGVHLVFQDPYQSLHSSMTIGAVVAEPIMVQGGFTEAQVNEKVRQALRDVRLPDTDEFLKRTPAELSGGQRQRLSFARGVIAQPQFIIADEPTSMLDVSLRQEVLRLMEDLRLQYGIGFIFITHDLSLAYHFCDRIIVMKNGSVMESGLAEEVIRNPQNDYTKALIQAVDDSLSNKIVNSLVSSF